MIVTIVNCERGSVVTLVSVALLLLPLACGESFSAASGGADAQSDAGSGGAAQSGAGGAGGRGTGGAGTGGAGTGGAGSSGRDSGTVADAADADAEPPPAIPTNGLSLWLRADRGVREEQGLVAVWEDQSGNHNDATQTASNVRPKLSSSGLGGSPRIEFDGSDDFLKLPAGFANFSQGVSVFATIEQNPSTACAAVVELSNGSEIDDISFGQFENRLLYEVYDQYTQGQDLPSGSSQLIVVVHRPNRSLELRRNGQLTGENNFTLPVNVRREQNFVGRSLYAGCVVFSGQIAELLVYSRAVNDAELVAIEAYMQQHAGCCTN